MPREQYGRFNANVNANAYISEQIRNEIQRFESVHPCIYTVYDLIELIPDQLLQNQLRDQVVCIE
uniref:AGAP1 protein n=2 Tax=Loa loa TaxID=7209 RepID=A0A1I7VCY0_LOALO